MGFTSACTFAALLVLAQAEPTPSQWGTIRGQVVVSGTLTELPVWVKKGDASAKDSAICAAADIPDETVVFDSKSKGLANVVVFLQKKPDRIHPDLVSLPTEDVVIRQTGCRYVPHITIMRAGQKLRVRGDDPIAHNPHYYSQQQSFHQVISPPGEDFVINYLKKAERLPIRAGCDIHPWMHGWVVLQDHPYVAVTNAQGEFEIANLPYGEHDFTVWQEKIGYVQKSLKINLHQKTQKLDPIEVPAEKLTVTK